MSGKQYKLLRKLCTYIMLKPHFSSILHHNCRAVVSGGARGALAPPEIISSVNPIPTRGGRLGPPHYR